MALTGSSLMLTTSFGWCFPMLAFFSGLQHSRLFLILDLCTLPLLRLLDFQLFLSSFTLSSKCHLLTDAFPDHLSKTTPPWAETIISFCFILKNSCHSVMILFIYLFFFSPHMFSQLECNPWELLSCLFCSTLCLYASMYHRACCI